MITEQQTIDEPIRNEQIMRGRNTKAKEGVKKFFQNTPEVTQTPAAFKCECSMLECEQQVSISIAEYEAAHERRDRFVIYPGHETDMVEKVITRKPGYYIVEKYALKS
jgi:hypothetical protein